MTWQAVVGSAAPWILAPTLLALSLPALVGCARDRELEMPVRAPQGPPPGPNVGQNAFNPPATSPAVTTAPPGPTASTPTPKPSSTGLPPAALPPLEPPPAPPASTAPPPKPNPNGTPASDKGDLAEMYRAQDQCLSSCDQFACMKIAAAYKAGTSGVPKDPLAGRRYAMHACQECGVAGPGIADQCPGYQLTPKATP